MQGRLKINTVFDDRVSLGSYPLRDNNSDELTVSGVQDIVETFIATPNGLMVLN